MWTLLKVSTSIWRRERKKLKLIFRFDRIQKTRKKCEIQRERIESVINIFCLLKFFLSSLTLNGYYRCRVGADHLPVGRWWTVHSHKRSQTNTHTNTHEHTSLIYAWWLYSHLTKSHMAMATQRKKNRSHFLCIIHMLKIHFTPDTHTKEEIYFTTQNDHHINMFKIIFPFYFIIIFFIIIIFGRVFFLSPSSSSSSLFIIFS